MIMCTAGSMAAKDQVDRSTAEKGQVDRSAAEKDQEGSKDCCKGSKGLKCCYKRIERIKVLLRGSRRSEGHCKRSKYCYEGSKDRCVAAKKGSSDHVM